IAEVSIQLGDFLRRGDLVARLDDEVLRDSLLIATAAKDSVANRQIAEIELQMREKQLQSYKKLLEAGDLTAREFQNHQEQADQSRARLAARLEEMNLRRLEHQRVETQLRKRRIFSPISGFVVDVSKQEGEFVSPTDPVVVRIVDVSKLRVVFSIPWKMADRIRVGEKVAIAVGQEEVRKTGRVDSIIPLVEPGSGSKQIVVIVENSFNDLCSGLPCRWLGDQTEPEEVEARMTEQSRPKSNASKR
ncbi:MAG: HlyD family efflux transporter periplasmic adaptor subunit, partial [Planctomycetota bacterium]